MLADLTEEGLHLQVIQTFRNSAIKHVTWFLNYVDVERLNSIIPMFSVRIRGQEVGAQTPKVLRTRRIRHRTAWGNWGMGRAIPPPSGNRWPHRNKWPLELPSIGHFALKSVLCSVSMQWVGVFWLWDKTVRKFAKWKIISRLISL